MNSQHSHTILHIYIFQFLWVAINEQTDYIGFLLIVVPRVISRFPGINFPVPGIQLPGSQKMTSRFPENDFPVPGK